MSYGELAQELAERVEAFDPCAQYVLLIGEMRPEGQLATIQNVELADSGQAALGLAAAVRALESVHSGFRESFEIALNELRKAACASAG